MKLTEPDRRHFLNLFVGVAVTATIPRPLLPFTASSRKAGRATITPLSFSGNALKAAFDQAAESRRLLGIFSPTCANCLKVCSDIQDVLSEHPDEDLKVFILWAPYGERDNVGLAIQSAEAYLPDTRVLHFWDMWRFGSRVYSPELRVPEAQAWDLILFYDPGVTWEDPVPKHSSWMQNRNLRTGSPYSRKGFENRFERWLQ